MQGIDFGYGKIPGKTIKDKGYGFVMRYLSHSPGKNITKQELTDFKANELQVGLVWETTEKRPLDGYQAGVDDARSAQAQLEALGFNLQQVVYFAVDSEMTPTQMLTVQQYIKGASSVIGLEYIGVYGGLNTVTTLLDKGLVTYAWQTLAWSHGKWDLRAHLRQTKTSGLTVAGVDCDLNEALNSDFGQLHY